MVYVIALLALIGHTVMFIAIVNRYHAVIIRRAVLQLLDLVWYVLAAGIPLAAAVWLLQHVIRGDDYSRSAWFLPICGYTSLCLVANIAMRPALPHLDNP